MEREHEISRDDRAERDEKLDFLRHLLQRLASERTLQGALDALAVIPDGIPAIRCLAVWSVEHRPDGDRLKLASCHGPLAAMLPSWTWKEGCLDDLSPSEPLIGASAGTGLPLVHSRREGWHPPSWAEANGIVAMHVMPLHFRGELEGVSAAFVNAMEEKSEKEHQWGKVMMNYLGAILATARAFDEVERLRKQLALENAYLRDEVKASGDFGAILGRSQALNRVLEQVRLVAPSEASVLILGESGTGKELVARAIHEASPRREHSLIRVNCASVPAELFESEFFGHVKGAFTGALRDRPGRFRLADGGTLFLDEVGEIPLALQSKLLRVLQEGSFEAVGDARTQKVDVRVVAATNKDLKQLVDAGSFREDLFYRLSVVPLEIPPLRKRLEDLPLLARHFVDRTSRTLRRPPLPLTDATLAELKGYEWPGNVRELQNACERAVIVAQEGRLDFSFLRGPSRAFLDGTPTPTPGKSETLLREEDWQELHRANLEEAMRRTRGRIEGPEGAAELLGLRPSTLRSRLRIAEIDPHAFH